MAINRSPMQKKTLQRIEDEKVVEPVVEIKPEIKEKVEVKVDPVVIEKKVSTPKKKKVVKPKQYTDDVDTLIAQIKRCLADGECEYEIPSQQVNALDSAKKIVECFRADDYDVCVSVVPTGYKVKIKRA